MSDGPAAAEVAPLLQTQLRVEHDIFVIRQRGREVAAALGLEHQDQIRIATALSEIGRQLLALAGGANVSFAVATNGAGQSVLEVKMTPLAPIETANLWAATPLVSRLVDRLDTVARGPDTVVLMSRRLPSSAAALTGDQLNALRDGLADSAPATPLDELTSQNQQLIAALDEVRRQRDELTVLNEELQETNRGVLALYGQLSEELEATNRGVVALYAELDEKSAQLRAASESKSRFLANISHELRAPVTAIMGLARMLNDSASDPLTEEQHQQVSLIRGSASDLLALVNDLLDLAKAESGRIEPNWAEIDLRAVFGQLRGTLRALVNRSEVELIVLDPPQPATIRTDEVLLAQVLRNLLHNGLKFTERGEVRMWAERSDEHWRLVVSDTGIGIPEELRERIFEEFYQAPNPLPGTTGTGLGLPYALRLVHLLGGSLEVSSAPGGGSRFTVTLPSTAS